MEVQSPRTGHTRAAIDPAATAGQPAASWFVPRVFGTASCEKSTYIAITRQTLAASAWPAADNGEVIVGVLQVPRDPRPVQAEVGHSGRTSNSPAARKCFVVDSKHRCLGQLGIQHLHQRAGGQRTRPGPVRAVVGPPGGLAGPVQCLAGIVGDRIPSRSSNAELWRAAMIGSPAGAQAECDVCASSILPESCRMARVCSRSLPRTTRRVLYPATSSSDSTAGSYHAEADTHGQADPGPGRSSIPDAPVAASCARPRGR